MSFNLWFFFLLQSLWKQNICEQTIEVEAMKKHINFMLSYVAYSFHQRYLAVEIPNGDDAKPPRLQHCGNKWQWMQLNWTASALLWEKQRILLLFMFSFTPWNLYRDAIKWLMEASLSLRSPNGLKVFFFNLCS